MDGGEPVTLFDRLVAELLASTQASRVTVRLCEEDVDPRLVAEALAPGVVSMANGSPDAIRTAGTYAYLEEERRILVQNDCRTGEPSPPTSLIGYYKVYAQMLAPVFVEGEMVATISVHQQDKPRTWSAAEVGALAAARATLEEELSSIPRRQWGTKLQA